MGFGILLFIVFPLLFIIIFIKQGIDKKEEYKEAIKKAWYKKE